MSAIKKPQLRGMLGSRLKLHATVGITFAVSMAAIWRFFYCDVRKQQYLDFYKGYDGRADFLRMRDEGVFQSVRPGGKVGTLD